MGIPTVNGAIVFDNRYLGNPLVYCGCVGLLPKNRISKAPRAGDRIVMAAIIHEVDLVHFVAPMHVAPVAIQVLKQYAGVKTSAYFTECPYDDDHTMKMAEIFDYCFVCDETSVAPFRARNPNTFYIGHAYNPEVHVRNGEEDYDADVRFIGTNFPSRVTFLAGCAACP